MKDVGLKVKLILYISLHPNIAKHFLSPNENRQVLHVKLILIIAFSYVWFWISCETFIFTSLFAPLPDAKFLTDVLPK